MHIAEASLLQDTTATAVTYGLLLHVLLDDLQLHDDFFESGSLLWILVPTIL